MKFKAFIICVALCAILAGCRSYYEETGTSITAGDIIAPLEISDSSDIINVRALFGMTGMRMWVARGCDIGFNYSHSYTNSYFFGLVETKGFQNAGGLVMGTNSISEIRKEFSTISGRE